MVIIVWLRLWGERVPCVRNPRRIHLYNGLLSINSIVIRDSFYFKKFAAA